MFRPGFVGTLLPEGARESLRILPELGTRVEPALVRLVRLVPRELRLEAEEPDFCLELDAIGVHYPSFGHFNKITHIRSGRIPLVHKEVGVFRAYLRTATNGSLQSTLIYQLCSRIPLWVPKNASATWFS